MRISVIIPSYNRVRPLLRALKSIYDQDSAVDEVIVVDDGSSDDSYASVSRNYPDVVLARQDNRGVSAARNTGIKLARYEWIALLDSDDTWRSDKISTIRRTQKEQCEYLLFHSDEIWIRNGVRVNPGKKHGKSGGWIFEKCLPLCAISPSATVLHRSLFESVSYFDESLPACEDYDLWLKICQRYPVCYIDSPLITKFGGHVDQLSRQHWGMDRFRIRSLNRLLEHAELGTEQRIAVEFELVKKLKILLKGAEKHANLNLICEFNPLLEQLQKNLDFRNSQAC